MKDTYVIHACRDDGTDVFMAIDYCSGGYEYWSKDFTNAKMYESVKEANDDLTRRMEQSRFLLHTAADVSLEKPNRLVTLSINRICLESVTRVDYRYKLAL